MTASVGRGVEDVLLREEHAGQPGDAALTQAFNAVRARGGIAIVIAHRRSALAGLDQLLLLASGQVQRLAPRRTAILGLLGHRRQSLATQLVRIDAGSELVS